jgi:cytoskeleton protein RodZ
VAIPPINWKGILNVSQFGEELRRERESRGVALETISEKTKVITRYLAALENEKFEALPGGILSKGIVRGYARTVGLDETEWVDRFLAASREHGAEKEPDFVEFAQNVGRSRVQPFGRRGKRLRRAGLAVALLLLAGAGWAVWHYMNARVMGVEAQQSVVSSAAATTAGSAASR